VEVAFNSLLTISIYVRRITIAYGDISSRCFEIYRASLTTLNPSAQKVVLTRRARNKRNITTVITNRTNTDMNSVNFYKNSYLVVCACVCVHLHIARPHSEAKMSYFRD
jgi:hypothetical protein